MPEIQNSKHIQWRWTFNKRLKYFALLNLVLVWCLSIVILVAYPGKQIVYI
jgi:hypothetical protein